MPPQNPWYGLTLWEHTLAELLSDAGYATGLFGKWHLGDTAGRFPTDQGFDEWWGIPRSSDRSFWPDSASLQKDAGVKFMHVMSAKRGETPKELGIRDDTIFIFTSDNGGYGGVGREGFNGPWRGSLFTSYEGSFRVPFLIRWPGKIPPRQKSNEIVHAMDVYATLAAMIGIDIPGDRIMDSADQSDFLMGKSKKSARESIVYYIGNEIVGVKWRNWKMLFKEMERIGAPLVTNLEPAFYNLLKDPQERERLRHYIEDSWIEGPLYRVLDEHQASIDKDPGIPNP